MELQFRAALDFYQIHINRSDFFTLLEEHNLRLRGAIPSITWELFGSILTGQKGRRGNGADLDGIEIKSAIEGSSFEYQYHLNTGLDKLKEDQVVDHLFCSYAPDYQSFRVYFATGKLLSPFFSDWIPQYLKNYNKTEDATSVEASERRQRFRRSIPFGWVTKNAQLVMEVRNGKLDLPHLSH